MNKLKSENLSVVPQNLPSHFTTRNLSFRRFLIFSDLAQESDKQTFLVSQTKIRVLLILQGSGLFHTIGLGFWLILAQF